MVARFAAQASRDFGKVGVTFSDEAIEHMLLCRWPGNVRQLAHEVRRVVALADSHHEITSGDLSADVMASQSAGPSLECPSEGTGLWLRVDRPLAESVDELERAAINQALAATGGGSDATAARLGLSRKGLYLKRRRLRI